MEIKNPTAQKIKKLEDLAIRPSFPFYSRSKNLQAHVSKVREILIGLLPNPLPFDDRDSLKNWLSMSLPLISWSPFDSPPDCISIFFFIRNLSTMPTETFVSEMIKRWLLPHQETTILSFDHLEFQFEHYLKETFFIGEAKVLVRNRNEMRILEKNLPQLKKEMILAVKQGDYAKPLLETKALPLDSKMGLIREGFIRLLKRYPEDLNETLFERLAFLQAHTSKEFRRERSHIHIGRIILTFLLAQKQLTREINAFPEKRHMKIRFMQTDLSFPFGKKPVLGLAISLNLFDEYEFFDNKHVLRAIEKLVPDVRIVAGSTYRNTSLNGLILNLYVEIEKKDGLPMTLGERQLLGENLEEELKKRVQRLVPTLFMVRNEEETMRNILMLSREIKSPDDLPQIMVSFDQHSQDDLTFTIVLLRVKKEGAQSIQSLLKNQDPKVKFIPDRVQNVSYLDKQHPIEANVFRLQIDKLHKFLRMDFSVNLYLARNEITSFLKNHLGPIRDYNGGMMIKQGELLSLFKRTYKELSNRNQELLENFFYSLNPIEAQATMPLKALSLFFELFIRLVESPFPSEKTHLVDFAYDEDTTVTVIRGKDPKLRTLLEEALTQTQIQDRSLISSSLSFEGSHYWSCLFEGISQEKHQIFERTIIKTLEKWQQDQEKLQTLRLPYGEITSLDPRTGGDQESSVLIKLLFNGLMRINKYGKPECATAKTYTISDDKKTYTFHLADTYWSDGSPVVAYDFEYAWKKVLSPNFSTPFAYVFYPIKNGKAAKEGDLPIEEVGVKALDDKTLVVDLENPAPYFIELTANTSYYPVNHQVDMRHPNWAFQKNEQFVCNGPYQQAKPTSGGVYHFKKNSLYPEHDQVQIDEIVLIRVDSKSAVEMFHQKQLHCFGSAVSPQQKNLQQELTTERITHYHTLKLLWGCFNVTQFPFNHHKIRKAFSMAIDREAIVKGYTSKRIPAYTPLPYELTLCRNQEFLIQENRQEAKRLFDEALEEIGIKLEEFPIITLASPSSEGVTFGLVKNQWEATLGIKCEIEFANWSGHFKKMTNRAYQFGGIYWASWLNDPIYTLQSFKYAREEVNFTGWENKKFQELLDFSDQTLDLQKRKEYLFRAEKMLVEDAVVLPICYGSDWYMKVPELILSNTTSNGNLDFSQAYFTKKTH
ncbi:peptide ABC transporter substrate-binding protein [Candidatus Neptunochlamydia vexilliferae]|nr:peptide ABC transporter substrate-binding protein [Candidatus Neptunochlamydia vexilliferae]